MLDRVLSRIQRWRTEKAYEIIDRDHQQDFEQWYEWYKHTPEAAVRHNLSSLDREQLRQAREEIDRELAKKDTASRSLQASRLDQLTLVLAEYMGCSKDEIDQRGRELELQEIEKAGQRREQEQADARAAVERGEINHVSEYIPF